MNKRILVIGSKGMAGHMIYQYLKTIREYHVADISRNNAYFLSTYTIVDIIDFTALQHVLQTEKPDVVINCIGILIQDAEKNPDRAILLNSYLPHFIARMGKELKFKLIHISTDCVFSGKKGNYAESDFHDGEGFYAQSKVLGEVTYGNHLTFRTSLVGPELKDNGIGLFHWFMQQKGVIQGYNKVIWTGITTLELAKAIHKAIQEDLVGLYHLVNNQKITKYQLLQLFKNEFERNDIDIKPKDNYVVDKSLIDTREILLLPGYAAMIHDMKFWMDKNNHMYNEYYTR
jgi:dTDP-4-dehydrorhamnose reductase